MASSRSAGGLVTETVSSLVAGVSQQADPVRQPDHAKEIINCLLSPVEGLKKRPPSQIVQNLTGVFSGDIALGPYSRTTTEAASGVAQVTVITIPLQAAGTKFTVSIDDISTPILLHYAPTYTVQSGDTLTNIATGIAAAINLVAGVRITATVVTNTVVLTAVNTNAAFTVAMDMDVTANAIAPSSLFTHSINRDLLEKYFVCIANGNLCVVDLLARTFPTVTIVGSAAAYLDTLTPGISIRALTVGDYTFIVNREITVGQLSTLSTVRDPEALIWTRMGNYGTKYVATLDGNDYSWYADRSEQRWIDTTKITLALGSKLPSGRGVSNVAITGTWAIGDVITMKNVAPFGGAYADATATYTVQEDPTTSAVESVHSIAVGMAEAWNFLADETSSGLVNAVPVDYDEDYSLQDNNVLFFGPTKATADAVGHSGAINITCTTTSSAGVVTASALSTQANTYEVIINGSSIYVKKYLVYATPTFQDFTIATSDGIGDQSIRAIKGEVQSIEDLPARGVNGFVVKVTGDASTEADDFYVQYHDAANVTNDGIWQETLNGGEHIALDPATMPHVLIRNADGTWTFEAASWDVREVGDLNSAPFPSFYNNTIDDLMFQKNRLGIASGQNTVYSSVGNYFNFFRVSIQQLLDEDIIDYTIAATEVAPIRHVVPLQNQVVLWSDRKQFIQAGNPLFTAKTIDVEEVTGFECSARVKPELIGKDIFFVVDRNNSTRVMEFYQTTTFSGPINDADDNTRYVPSYCKGKPLALCGSDTARMVFVATLTNTNDIYVYNYWWKNENQLYQREASQLLQAAWSTWRFEDGNILGIDFMDNVLLLVIQRGPIVMLEKVEILPEDVDNQPADTPSDHVVNLDMRFGTQDFSQFGVTVAYDSGTNETTWTFATDTAHAVPLNPMYPMTVVKKATPTDDTTPELPGVGRGGTNTISAVGNWTTTDVWIGLKYPQEFDFSRLYIREQTEDGQVKAITDGETQLRDMRLDYIGGYFEVWVQPDGRSTPYIYVFDGDAETEEGTFSFPVLAQNTMVTITLKNSTHRTSTFTGFSWDGMFQRRTGR